MSLSAHPPSASQPIDERPASQTHPQIHQPSASASALAVFDAVQRQLEGARAAVLSLDTEKVAALRQQENLSAQVAQLQTEIEQLRVQLDKSSVETENLTHQNAELHERGRQADIENARLNADVAALARQIEAHQDLSESHATLQAEKREAEQENTQLQSRVADLVRENEEKEREKDDLFAQVLDLHDLQIDDLPTLIIEMARQLTGAEVGLFTQSDGDDVIASLGMDDLKPEIANALFEFTRRVHAENAPLVENNGAKLPDGSGLVNLSALPVAAKGKNSGVLLLANKRNGGFNAQDTKLLLSIGQHAGIALENVRLHHELNEAYASTIAVLADAIEAKDAYTRGHCESVMRLAVEVGRRLELKGEKLDEVRYSALLHDVGKIGVPDGILLKPGKLMDEEFLIIQKHPAIGRDLVSRVPTLSRLTDAILHHHEKWDGSGYPDGLAGEGIPLVARIVGAVDAFDAMTTPRPYRDMVSHQDAVNELKRCAGTQFDPQIVDLIDQILHQGMEVNPEKNKTEHSALLETARQNLETEDEEAGLGDVMSLEDLPGAEEIEGVDLDA